MREIPRPGHERPSQLARLRLALEEDLGALQRALGLIVIDEIHREPSLLPLLRALIDEPQRRAGMPARLVASPDRLCQALRLPRRRPAKT